MAQLNITVSEFLKNCSHEEKQELSELLGKNGFPLNSENSEGLKMSAASIFESNRSSMLKLFTGNEEAAIYIMDEIKLASRLDIVEILPLMPLFNNLEKLRVKSLVSAPQEKKENE